MYSIVFAVMLSISVFAQATLPSTWGFATSTLPSGWSEINVNSGTAPYYSGSGNPAPAYRLDNTGDMLIVNFASTPGNLTYDMVGNNTGGPWSGTLLVQESVNGSTWTTIRTISTLTASYAGYTDVPNTASRYIRFNFSNKVSGNNIGLDNVSIAAGVSATQEISVKQGTTTYVNGSTYTAASPVSTTLPITFTIYNLGLATLNISNISVSGTNAADFVVGTFPSTVNGTSNANFNIDFTPSASGTRSAILTIANDDVNANPYIINLYCVGGTLFTEPAAQPTNLSFSNVKSYRFTGTFSAASGSPSGYIVLRRTGSPVADMPIDGVAYQKGDVIGSSSVVFSGSNTSFIPSYIVANTTYHFAVFAYNGTGSFRNYLTTAPLTGNITSLGSMQPGTYYNSVSTAAPSFVTDLHNKINPHTMQFYSSYGQLMMSQFYARDTTGGQRVVTCSYSGLVELYNEPWDWASNNFSREHTYPYSWMPTTNQNLPEYNDYHHLMPANQNEVNAIRSNYPLGVVVGTPAYTYLGCKLGLNAQGKTVFEPRDEHKGDAARALMYMTVCYTGVSGNLWALPSFISGAIPYGQDQDVLKQWHYQDPPDNHEIARNDYVDSLQGNRNPFVDSVQYACYIDFSNMTKIASPSFPCVSIGVNEGLNNSVFASVYPNPNNGIFSLTYVTGKNEMVLVNVYDVMGRVVYSQRMNFTAGSNSLQLSLENLSKGIYSMEMIADESRIVEKVVIK